MRGEELVMREVTLCQLSSPGLGKYVCVYSHTGFSLPPDLWDSIGSRILVSLDAWDYSRMS